MIADILHWSRSIKNNNDKCIQMLSSMRTNFSMFNWAFHLDHCISVSIVVQIVLVHLRYGYVYGHGKINNWMKIKLWIIMSVFLFLYNYKANHYLLNHYNFVQHYNVPQNSPFIFFSISSPFTTWFWFNLVLPN